MKYLFFTLPAMSLIVPVAIVVNEAAHALQDKI